MAISDIVGQVEPPQTVEITTVDRTRRTIEGKGRDGGIIRIPIYYIPTLFRWPKTGEYWVVRREGGEWTLVTSIDPAIQARSGESASEAAIPLEDLKEGEVRLYATPNSEGSGLWLNNHQAVRQSIHEVKVSEDESQFDLEHGLGTRWVGLTVWIEPGPNTTTDFNAYSLDDDNTRITFWDPPSQPETARVVITG